ncbi:MAG: hypothetical protein JW969_09770 [Spirochaetales bacterium]|nr:hypothetical protein [Spirochaetales bacterium]
MKTKIEFIICVLIALVLFACDGINDYNGIARDQLLNSTVLSPFENDLLEIGDSTKSLEYSIRWSSDIENDLKIELIQGEAGNEVTKQTITNCINKNTGKLNWTPSGCEEGDKYKIRCTFINGPYSGRHFDSGKFRLTKWHDLWFNGEFDSVKKPTLPAIAVGTGKIVVSYNRNVDQATEPNSQRMVQKWKTYTYLWNGVIWSGNISEPDNVASDDVYIKNYETEEFENTIEAFTFDLKLDKNDTPVLIYSNPFLPLEMMRAPSAKFNTCIKSFNGSSWRSSNIAFSPVDHGELPELEERVAPSILLNDGNYRLFYITPPLPFLYPANKTRIYLDWCLDSLNPNYKYRDFFEAIGINIEPGSWLEALLNEYLKQTYGKTLDDKININSSYKLNMMEWDGSKWVTDPETQQISHFLADLTLNFTSGDLEGIFSFFTTVGTSVVVDGNQNTYIAYSDSTDTDTPQRTFRVIKLDTNGDVSHLSGGFLTDNSPVTHDFSLAIGRDNRPVVAYTDELSKQTIIIEWDPDHTTWNFIRAFSSPEKRAPSIRQDKDKNIIVACEEGVYKWYKGRPCQENNINEYCEWDSLGNPGIGSGDPSWWIGSNDKFYAVTYVDDAGKVWVKTRSKETGVSDPE